MSELLKDEYEPVTWRVMAIAGAVLWAGAEVAIWAFQYAQVLMRK